MTTILTPVEKLKAGAEFMIGATEYRFADSRAYAYASDSNSSVPLFYTLQLHYIFPDGVPVIQPDKPKEVRAVIERTGNVFYVHLYPNPTVMGWVLDHTDPGKTYDLVLTEREEK